MSQLGPDAATVTTDRLELAPTPIFDLRSSRVHRLPGYGPGHGSEVDLA